MTTGVPAHEIGGTVNLLVGGTTTLALLLGAAPIFPQKALLAWKTTALPQDALVKV